MLRIAVILTSLLLTATADEVKRPERRPVGSGESQPNRRPVVVEILVQSQPVYRVRSQEWGKALQDIGYFPRFRSPRPGEEIRVEEADVDGLPSVLVVCGMAADGSIRIRNQRYTIADTGRLKAQLDEFALFGAGGSPSRDSRWGMTDSQLLELTKRLSESTEAAVSLSSPVISVSSVGLPDGIRIRFTEAAQQTAFTRRPASAPESLPLAGISKGTATAIILAQYGLGFRPHRLSSESYELEIDVGGEDANLWPIGWKAQESTAVILPAWLKAIEIDVEEVDVSSIVQVVSERINVPVFMSSFQLAAAGRDPDELTYSRQGRISPFRLLTGMGDKLNLGFDIRVDEGGNIFLWTTTAEQAASFRRRFAHIKPKA